MPDNANDLAALLAKVPADVAIANGRLREGLGWDEVRYAAARDALVLRGELKKGPGQGGTVRRVGAGGNAATTVAIPEPDHMPKMLKSSPAIGPEKASSANLGFEAKL